MRHAFILILMLVMPMQAFASHSSKSYYIEGISLAYSSSTSMLSVHAKVRSSDPHNYVTKMTVSLNGHQFMTVYYKRRKNTEEFADNVVLKAKTGDLITATLYSSEGGNKSLDLSVSDQEITEARSTEKSFSETTGYSE